jgi:transposase
LTRSRRPLPQRAGSKLQRVDRARVTQVLEAEIANKLTLKQLVAIYNEGKSSSELISKSTMLRFSKLTGAFRFKVVNKVPIHRTKTNLSEMTYQFTNVASKFIVEGKHFVFCDEATVCISDSDTRRWSTSREQATLKIPSSRTSVKLLCALDCFGCPYYQIRYENTDSEVFFKFLKGLSDKLSKGKLFNSQKPGDVVVVLDNATWHKSENISTSLSKLDFILLYLPPYSPWLNPIELLFSQLKRYLRTKTLSKIW